MVVLHRILKYGPTLYLLIFMVPIPAKTDLPALFRIQLTPEKLDDFKAANLTRYLWDELPYYRPVDLVAYKEEDEAQITSFLTQHGFPVERIELARIVKAAEEMMKNGAALKTPGEISWDTYYTLDEVYTWMDNMCEKYRELAKCTEIGRSIEDRPIRMIQISNGNSNPDKKSAIFDSIHHAREWITLSFTTYMINELLVNSSEYTELLDKLDIFVIPIVNPDGYVYSHLPGNLTDEGGLWILPRYWRKNRRIFTDDPEKILCNGVDLNRNYGFEFKPGGSPCGVTYAGESAFSEPEIRAVRDVLLEEKGRARFYFSIHSYGQYWFTPWGYTNNKPEDYPELLRVATCGVSAMKKVHGEIYDPGPAGFYESDLTGIAIDWARGEAGIKYSFSLELRNYGDFDLPIDQILPTVQETWAGVLAALLECPEYSPDPTSTTTTNPDVTEPAV